MATASADAGPAMETIYVSPPPPGVVPNYDNPAYIGYRMITVNAVCLSLSTAVIALRLYTRGWIVRAIGIDDWAMIASWAFCVALGGLTMRLTEFGLGMHMWEIPLALFSPNFTLLNLIASVIYAPGIFLCKASILFLYLRLSPAKLFRAAVYVTMAIAFGYSTSTFFTLIFACTPIRSGWDLSIPPEKCINRNALYFAVNGFNIFTDVVILLLPVRLVLGLQIPQRQKLGLLFIFMTGGFVCVVAIIRLYSLVGLSSSPDLSWETVNALSWCIIEANVGIICGSISTLKPFLKAHLPQLLGSSLSGSGSKADGSKGYGLRSYKGSRIADDAGFRVNQSTCNGGDGKRRSRYIHDGLSEESIISDEDREGQIVKRTEVVVEYHNQSNLSLDGERKVVPDGGV